MRKINLMAEEQPALRDLHNAAKDAGNNLYEFKRWLQAVEKPVLEAALALQGHKGNSILVLAAKKLSNDEFKKLMNTVDAGAVDSALKVQNKNKETSLISLANLLGKTAFQLVIKNATGDGIDAAVQLVNENNWTGLHFAAQCQDGSAFVDFIKKTDQAIINQILLKKENSVSAFAVICEKQPITSVIEILLIADDRRLKEILQPDGPQARTVFLALQELFQDQARDAEKSATIDKIFKLAKPNFPKITYQSQTEIDQKIEEIVNAAKAIDWQGNTGRDIDKFVGLVVNADSEVLNKVIILRIDNLSIFERCVKNLESNDFKNLITKVDDRVIDSAIVARDLNEYIDFLTAVRYLQNDACVALIEKASVNAINKVLPLQGNDGWCALKATFKNQTGKAVSNLIEKASSEAISQALPLTSKENWTALHTAAWHQGEAAFLSLIAKASSLSINKSLFIRTTDGNKKNSI